jgi:hypothetical protein
VSADSDTVDLEISLDELRRTLASAVLHVIDALDGMAVVDAIVDLDRGDAGSTRVGASSEAVIERVPPGLRRLSIAKDGFEKIDEWIEIQSGRVNDLGTWTLDRAASLRGRVLDQHDQPVEAAIEVCALDHPLRGVDPISIEHVRSNRAGAFEFKSAGRRRYLVRVADRDWAALPVIADARVGPIDDLVLRVAHSGELIVSFPIEPPEGAYYRVETSEGVPVAVQACDGCMPLRLPIGYGSYHVYLMDGAHVLSGRDVYRSEGAWFMTPERTQAR